MKLLTAIKLAWKYLQMPADDQRWTYKLAPGVFHINPEVSGVVEGWALEEDNHGQVVIYTEHYPDAACCGA